MADLEGRHIGPTQNFELKMLRSILNASLTCTPQFTLYIYIERGGRKRERDIYI